MNESIHMTATPDFPLALSMAVKALALVVPGLFAFALLRGSAKLRNDSGRKVIQLFRVAFLLWLIAGWGLSAKGALEVGGGTFPAFIRPVGLTVVFGLLLLFIPTWRRVVHQVPMQLLLGVEAIRIFGFIFLLLAQSGVVPESFGYQAAWGDMLVGWLSIAAIIIWITKRKYRVGFVIFATIIGMADAANALRHVLESYPEYPVFGEFPFAVLFTSVIPLLLLSHLYVLFKVFFGPKDLTPVEA